MDELDDFREAGKIASKIRDESKRLIIVGECLFDIAETIEKMIYEEGAKPAFPVNISINEIAAHYTPDLNSEVCLGEEDLVKIDIGTEVNGGIGDTAYTVDLSEKHEKLVKASDEALANAIEAIKPGVKVGEVGDVIEKTITKYEFKPISNLSGHMIKPGVLHAGIDIPNVKTEDPYEFQVGDVFAVEPFATNGKGYVVDEDEVSIFSLYMPGEIKMRQSRKVVDFVVENYGMLPFAERWVRKNFSSKLLVTAALRELLESQFIKAYPILREAENGLVSQAEHTVVVTEGGNEVLTK